MAGGRVHHPEREAQFMADAIAQFSRDLDPPDRAAFFRRLVEILTERREELESFIHGDDPS
jgi:acyl-CoA reductase-like NAD-dependent aldehyde dehydrogenase